MLSPTQRFLEVVYWHSDHIGLRAITVGSPCKAVFLVVCLATEVIDAIELDCCHNDHRLVRHNVAVKGHGGKQCDDVDSADTKKMEGNFCLVFNSINSEPR